MTERIPEISFPATVSNLVYLKSYKKNRVYFETGSGYAITGAKLIRAAVMNVLFTILIEHEGREFTFIGKLYKVETTLDHGMKFSFDMEADPPDPFIELVNISERTNGGHVLVTCYADAFNDEDEVVTRPKRQSEWIEKESA